MAQIDVEQDDFQLGTGLNASGDINGDQINDLLVGAVSALEGLATKSGRTYLFYGRADTLSTLTMADQADVQIYGAAVKDYIGRTHAAADINADGKADILIGGGYANVQGYVDVGSTFLFFGN